MRRFIPLAASGLPAGYDAQAQGASPIVEVSEPGNRIELVFRFPGYFSVERPQEVKGQHRPFQALEIAGVGQHMVSGKPELPTFGRYVQIPSGSTFTLKVSTPEPAVEFKGVDVAPAQAAWTDAPTPPKFEYDEKAYASDDAYPRQMVTASGPMVIDGYNALLLHVCPFQYHAKSRRLLAYPRIEVAIELKQGGATDQASAAPSREAFGNLFLNPRRALADPAPAVGTGTLVPPLMRLAVGPELLIVHATRFAAAARRLAAWKNRRGLITELLEYKAPVNTLAALKATIRSRRGQFGARLRYVVMLGDADDIPCESRNGMDTDFYYSTRQDYNEALQSPWLALGRIPVRDEAEAQAVVDQIVAYERTPPADAAYYRRFVAAAHFETHLENQGGAGQRAVDGRDYAFTMETIRAYLQAQGYDAERVYTCDRAVGAQLPLYYRNGTPVPADLVADLLPAATATQRLVDAATEGHLIIAHRDHGSEDGWYMPPLSRADLDRITGTMPSLFHSVNCLTGAFQATTTTECFAEKILRQPGTAPTLIAATELSNTWHNNALMLGLFDALYGGLLPTFPGTTASYPIRFNRFGDVLNYARAYLATSFAGNPLGVLANYEMYHVLGDPSLEVWTAQPKPLSVRARLSPLLVPAQRSLLVELSVPAPHCVITLWYGDKLLKRVESAGTRLTIALPSLPVLPTPLPLRQTLQVCAWAPGYRFAEARVSLPLVMPAPVVPA
jgi:hypothetical protein